jgi:hypothetical protein
VAEAEAVAIVEISSVPEADSGEAGTHTGDLGAGHELISGAAPGEFADTSAAEVITIEFPGFCAGAGAAGWRSPPGTVLALVFAVESCCTS